MDAAAYWERRYARGGNSGSGSRGALADHKANVLNRLFAYARPQSVLDLGCGDGRQLTKLHLPDRYVGCDISPTAVERCRQQFPGDPRRNFVVAETPEATAWLADRYDLAMALDVLYHVLTPEAAVQLVATLFRVARHWVVIYSYVTAPQDRAAHIQYHDVCRLAAAHLDWELFELVPPQAGTDAAFFIYRRKAHADQTTAGALADAGAPT